MIAASLMCLGALAWAPPLYRTVVVVRSVGQGLEFTVNGQSLGERTFEDVTLEHAINDNPQMRIENIYEDALILLCPQTNVSARNINDVRRRLALDGFANIRVGQQHECSNLP